MATECPTGHRCCINEEPGHTHRGRLPDNCEWCLAMPTAAEGLTSPSGEPLPVNPSGGVDG